MLPLPLSSAGGEYSGPPRLIDITPQSVALNGVPTLDLVAALTPLMDSPQDMVILRGKDGATLQHVVTVSQTLQAAGFASVVLVE